VKLIIAIVQDEDSQKFISEMMIITHNKMLLSQESWLSVQLALDVLVLAALIFFFRKQLQRIADSENVTEG